MLEEIQNIWDIDRSQDWIAIMTNYGWRGNGTAVFGRGTAAQAKQKFNGLEEWYGKCCKEYYEESKDIFMPIQTHEQQHLVMFPTKKLNARNPELSWQEKGSIAQIAKSARSLMLWIHVNGVESDIYIPRPGCGNGELKWDEVKPYLEILPDNVICVTSHEDNS